MDSEVPSALPILVSTIPPSTDSTQVAKDWFTRFTVFIEAKDFNGILSILSERPFWRDILALTWDFRTFDGPTQITRFLSDCVPSIGLLGLKLNEDSVELQTPFPDVAWIQGMFGFETNIGQCSGVFRLVLTDSGEWKGHCVFTNLEDLKGFPEQIGALRNHEQNYFWAEQRRLEVSFADKDPVVLICGGGQSGLELAARLKSLNVPTLVIEKNTRIGDNWRHRYDSLCLHDPVCEFRRSSSMVHSLYKYRFSQGFITCRIFRECSVRSIRGVFSVVLLILSFPPTWPVYTPGPKVQTHRHLFSNQINPHLVIACRLA